MVKEYAIHRYPCIDMYPPGKEYVTASDLERIAQQQLKRQGLRGKLSVSKEKRKLRAAFKVSAIWQGRLILVSFLDGTTEQKEWVREVIQRELEPLVDRIRFKWHVIPEEGDIRISFKLKGQAWSTVGTDAKQIPSPQPTMNLGWLDNNVDYGNEKYRNTGQVVLHEFGHAMGMIHEHQNPKSNPIKWNKPVVIEELSKTQGWDIQTINHNMFAKYGDKELCEEARALDKTDSTRAGKIKDYCEGEVVNGSQYDVNSIMHYFYPARWIEEGPVEIPVNTVFSELDKVWLRKYYGKATETNERVIVEGYKSDMTPVMKWSIIVTIIIITLVVLYYVGPIIGPTLLDFI